MSSRGSGGGRGGGGFGVERLGELVEFVRARWLLPGEYRVTITRSHRVPGIGEIHGGGKGDGNQIDAALSTLILIAVIKS